MLPLLASVREARAVQALTGIQAAYDNITGAAKTNNDYNSTGAGPTFPTTTGYHNTFNVGTNNNLHITGFDIGTNNYLFVQLANNINLARVNNPVVTGAENIILYEQYSAIGGGTNLEQKCSYQPTMEATLLSDSVNRGADNVFCNQGNGDGNNNNIERIDYVFGDGYPAYNSLNLRGFLVMDRGGNDALRIAAITNVTASGIATGWATKVQVQTTNWGLSGIVLDTVVYRGYDTNRPSSDVGGAVNQNLTGVFVTWAELGVATNQLIYGYSLTANDVTNTDWSAPTNFPLATDENNNNGGLDLMSGGAMFFDSSISARIGDFVWDDYNGNGIQDPGEPGLTNILVKIYDDHTNLAAVARTDSNGMYLVSGLTASNYFVRFTLPTNVTYVFSSADQGGDNTLDSDPDTNTGQTISFSLPASTTNRDYDAGMHRPPTDLGVFKTVNNTNPNVLQSITYTIKLTNNGPSVANLITVTDAIPDTLTYTTSTVSQGSYNSTSDVWVVGTVNSGSNATLTITAQVNTNTSATRITNTVSIIGADRPDNVSTNNSASVEFLVQSADLGVGKTVSNTNPAQSNLVTYAILFTNSGPNTASNIIVNDQLPAGLTFVSNSVSQGTYTNSTGIWNIGTVTNGGTATLSITGRVNNLTGGQTITNTATVTSSTHEDSNTVNNTASVTLVVQASDLIVTKTVDVSGPNEGETIVYSILLFNAGPNLATNITLYDKLTNTLTFVTNSLTQGTYTNSTGIWNVGTLDVNTSALLTITATVNTNTKNTSITNTAYVTGSSQPDPVLTNNTGSVVIAVSALTITKIANLSTSAPGSNITWTITVTNSGTTVHTNVNITDPVPTGTTFVSGSATVTYFSVVSNTVREEWNTVAYTNQNGTTNWIINWTEEGDDAAAASGDVTVSPGGGRTNILYIDRPSNGIYRTANLSTYTNAVLSFDLLRFAMNATSDYIDIFVSTNGTANVVRLDRFAGATTNATFLSTNYNVTAYISTNTIVRFYSSPTIANNEGCYFDNIELAFTKTITNVLTGSSPASIATNVTLRPGYVATVTFQATIDNPSSYTQIVNTASVTSEIQRSPVYDIATTKVQNTDLGVVKTVNNANPKEGSNIVYTIVVTNNGLLNATGVRITDVIPTTSVTYVTNTVSQGSFNPTTGVWTVNSVAWSNFATLTITARVVTNTAGTTFTNTARISGSDQSDSNPNNNTSSVPVTVNGVDLGVTKTVNDNQPVIGTNITFTIVLTNNGPNNATSVIVTDSLPSGLTFVTNTVSQGAYTNSTGLWNVGNLTASNYATMTITATVLTNTAAQTRTNIVTITSLGEHDTVTNNNSSSVIISPRSYNLTIAKTSNGGGLVDPGQNVTYTVIVSNQAATAQDGIEVDDATPTGATYVAATTLITKPDYTTNSFLDQFNSRLFSNQDGNTNWANNWQESEGDGAAAGDTQVLFDPTRGATFTLQFQGATVSRTLSRTANLATYTNATLSFVFRRDGLAANQQVIVQVTTNAGAGTWVELDRYSGAATDTAYRATNYNIKTYITTNTGIRFITTNLTMGAGNKVWFDDVEIDAARRQTNTFSGGAPTTLATNMYLEPGDYASIAFQVTVDNPQSYSQIVNNASATGTLQTIIYASVTDKVALADLKVTKTVNNSAPQQGSLITFTIVVTNIGPNNTTNVILNETLPSGVTYSNHVASQGVWTNTTGIWTVGVLNVSSAATLTVTAKVNSGTAFQTFTNCASITASSKYDPVGTNNTNCVTFAPVFTTPDVAVTNCAYLETNGAVMLWHVSATGQLYDLLYVDALSFADSLSNQWALADERTGTFLSDTGSSSRTPPHSLGNTTLRFYRVSAPGYWESTNAARYASAEVLGVGTVYMYPGFNWIRTWGTPCNNRMHDVYGHQITGSSNVITAPQTAWCALHITQEVWLASMGSTQQWLYAIPTNLSGTSAEDLAVPLDRGVIITLPTTSTNIERMTMLFRVPTNTTVATVPGATNATGFSLWLPNPNIPQTLNPTQLLFVQAGMKGGANPGPAHPDQIWRFNRTNQQAVEHMFYRTTDSNFIYAATLGTVPSTYKYPYNEAIGYRRYTTNALVWTNRIYYTPPTLNMSP